MRLAASNIAWNPDRDEEVAAILQQHGASGVELAPTKYWPAPCAPSQAQVQQVRRFWEDRGLPVVALQSLLFGMTDASIFGDAEGCRRTSQYLTRIIRVAAGLGARALVFGSPGARKRGERSFERAVDEAAGFFRPLAKVAADQGCVIAFEPNPVRYGCDFCNTVGEALQLVDAVGSPGFALQVDLGVLHVNGEPPLQTIAEGRRAMAHVHISEPDLKVIGQGGVHHREMAQALARADWRGFVSIEMRGGAAGEDDSSRVREACEHAVDAGYRLK